MIIDVLRQEHRNIEKLLLVLERELDVFAWGERPDYEVVQAVIAYFQSIRILTTIRKKTWYSKS